MSSLEGEPTSEKEGINTLNFVLLDAPVAEVPGVTQRTVVVERLTIVENMGKSVPMVTPESIGEVPEQPATPVTPEKKRAPRKAAAKEKAEPKKAPTPRKKASKKVEQTAAETTEKLNVALQSHSTFASAGIDIPVAPTLSFEDLQNTEAMRSNESILVAAQPFTSSAQPAMSHTPESPAEVQTTEHTAPVASETVQTDEHHAAAEVIVAQGRHADISNFKSIHNVSYFSPTLREWAKALHEHDDAGLVQKLTTDLEDNDGAALETILVEFRRCQNAVATLAIEKTEESYASFQVALERFFKIAEPYTKADVAVARPGAAESARADTAIERSTLGTRVKFLIKEIQEMTSPIPGIPAIGEQGLVRTTMAQHSTGPLFGNERQQEMRGFLKQTEEIYGSKGLKYSTGFQEFMRNAKRWFLRPQRRVNSFIGNIRGPVLRNTVAALAFTAEFLGLGYGVTKTAQYMYSSPAAAVQPAQNGGNPLGNPNPNPGQPTPNVANSSESQDQQAIEKIFQEMTLEAKGDNLHVKFQNTGALQLNSTLYVVMGEGSHLATKLANPIGGNEYTIQLQPSEKAKGTELQVSIQGKSSFGTRNFLVPKDNGKDAYKTVKIQ